jgi:phosphohistidine swiveling domain-containing protein
MIFQEIGLTSKTGAAVAADTNKAAEKKSARTNVVIVLVLDGNLSISQHLFTSDRYLCMMLLLQ